MGNNGLKKHLGKWQMQGPEICGSLWLWVKSNMADLIWRKLFNKFQALWLGVLAG